MDNERIKRSVKLFPWVSGLSADMVFWITINTLFLSTVRGFTTAQIVLLSTIASGVSLVVQPVMMWLASRFGNSTLSKIGKLAMFVSSLMFMFGPTYGWAVAAMLVYKEGWALASLDVVAFKNNINYLGRGEEFLGARAKRSLVYAVATMVASVSAGLLFNISPYLPVILGAILCGGCFLISCWMTECPLEKQEKKKEKQIIPFKGILVWILLSYGLFSCLLSDGTTNSKLLIQEELLLELPLDTVTIVLSFIVTLSRLSRVVSDVLFSKMYRKWGNKCIYIFSFLQVCAYLLMIGGAFLDHTVVPKTLVLAAGYILLLFVWDPYTILTENLILENATPDQRGPVSLLRGMIQKGFSVLVNIAVSAILMNWPTLVAFYAMTVLVVIELLISIKLYRMLRKKV